MSCSRWRSALVETALGAPAPAGLPEHLGSCASCRAGLEAERLLLGRIDAELVAALDVAPSPELAARVRQRVAESPPARPWWMPWLVPAGVGLAMLALGILVGRRGAAPGPGPAPRLAVAEVSPAPVTPSAHVAAEPTPVEPPATPAQPKPAPATAAAPARTVVRAPEPEVLVPPGQHELVMRFARDVRQPRVDRSALLAAGFDPGETKSLVVKDVRIAAVEVPGVEVKPLGIEPLDKE